jgi:hypothetical protein
LTKKDILIVFEEIHVEGREKGTSKKREKHPIILETLAIEIIAWKSGTFRINANKY